MDVAKPDLERLIADAFRINRVKGTKFTFEWTTEPEIRLTIRGAAI